jgi:hypothetical protein
VIQALAIGLPFAYKFRLRTYVVLTGYYAQVEASPALRFPAPTLSIGDAQDRVTFQVD